jgi:hypothetical protein
LDCILGAATVAQHAHGDPVSQPAIPVVKLSERLMIAGREARGEFLVAACRYDARASC